MPSQTKVKKPRPKKAALAVEESRHYVQSSAVKGVIITTRLRGSKIVVSTQRYSISQVVRDYIKLKSNEHFDIAFDRAKIEPGGGGGFTIEVKFVN